MADPREYLRCAACGKLSVPERFDEAHDPDAHVQRFVGGGNAGWREGDTKARRRTTRERRGEKGSGFEWGGRNCTRAELALMDRALRRGLGTIAKMRGAPAAPDIERLQRQIAERDEIIRRQARGLELAADKIERLQRR